MSKSVFLLLYAELLLLCAVRSLFWSGMTGITSQGVVLLRYIWGRFAVLCMAGVMVYWSLELCSC